MGEPLFLQLVSKEQIWGGTYLHNNFSYILSSSCIGECWAFSDHQNGVTKLKNGKFAGRNLEELWLTKPWSFCDCSSNVYSLLMKIIDAKKGW